MGEVYRARDTKLNRDVAIKVLLPAVAEDPDRLARFSREAQVLASLNHPNIAQIYGFEDSRALVMELVEGPTLADLLSPVARPTRALFLEEALPIAKQIAEALEAAHEQGIIHRDLKPANIKVTPDGVVKVLDFGLAKLTTPDDVGRVPRSGPAGAADLLTQSPTITSPAMMTGVGMILGTAAYMSPEQAKGRPADKRSDVWAFGCVLYEMLTGRRAFEGEDVSDTMAAVLRAEPNWTALPADTPPAIRRLVRLCLEKDRRQRIPDIAIARFDIDEAVKAPTVDSGRVPTKPRGRWLRVAAVAAIVAGACALTGAAVWSYMRPEPLPVTRFDIAPSATAPFSTGIEGVNLVVSPDGSQIVYHVRRGEGALELRRFDELQGRVLPGTDGARWPAFSPDGRHLVFLKEQKLHTLALDTTASVAIANGMSNMAGLAWVTDGEILFGRTGAEGGLYRVPAAGGSPERIAAPDAGRQEVAYGFPQPLPGGREVLFTIRQSAGAANPSQIALRSLDTGEQRVLIAGSSPRYVESGHLLYMQGATLMAVAFDASRREVTGAPVAVQEGVVFKGASGVANYSVARNGTLVYVPGSGVTYTSRFIWKDRNGRLLGAASDALEFPRYGRLSPDGRRFVATVGPSNGGHIWTFGLAGSTQPQKLTFSGHNIQGAWAPDGTRIVFSATQGGASTNLHTMPADGSRIDPERLLTSDNGQGALDWSPDGQWIMFQEVSGETGADLWVLRTGGDRKPEPWLRTMFSEAEARFSPDGRWVAYVSDQTGQAEVWVRPFPGPGSPIRVSSNSGHDPAWGRDGTELFYQEENKLMAVAVTAAQAGLQFQQPRMLFEDGFVAWEPNTPRTYDVAPDGRFLMIEQPATYRNQRFAVVLNWFEELKRRVPAN